MTPQAFRRQNRLFIAIASVIILAIAVLHGLNRLPLNLDSRGSLSVMPSGWHQFVAIAALILPIAVWVVQRHNPAIRLVLSGYLMVLLAQIITELVLLQRFSRGMSVVIGTVYSAFRLVQLWQGQQIIALAKLNQSLWIRVVLWMLFLIWSVNLIQFLVFRWPIMLNATS
ncbi:MAG: hypothetical protein AAFU78_04095 [Cyanobacteria bacterium J06633_2]